MFYVCFSHPGSRSFIGLLGLRSKCRDGAILGRGGKGEGAALALKLGHARLRPSCICRYTSFSARSALSFPYVCCLPIRQLRPLTDFIHSSSAQRAPPPLRKSVLGPTPSRNFSASPLITPPQRPRTQVRCRGSRQGAGPP